VHDVSDVRQIEMHTAEPLVPGPSHLEVDISAATFKKYKSPGSDKIPAELYQAGCETLVSVIHKLITSIWNKEEMPDQWKKSVTVTLMINLTVVIDILSNILLSKLNPYLDDITGEHQCGLQRITSIS
jgi:hypothetical protein